MLHAEYGFTKNLSGGVLDAPTLENGLNYIKGQQQTNKLNVVNALVTAGRDPNTPLVLSEYNPESWEGIFYYGLHQTVAEALGEVETIFTFAELGIHTAHFFVYPTYPSATIETPVCKVFEELQNYMGDKLMDSYSDGSFRLYTTKESSTGAGPASRASSRRERKPTRCKFFPARSRVRPSARRLPCGTKTRTPGPKPMRK
jgi:hypothetical protein